MGDILKEAIADAKAVRETALANAKMALEEAFTPQLKSMLSAKLREDDDEFEDEEEFGGEEEPEVPAEDVDIDIEDEEGEEEFGGEEEPEEGSYHEDDEEFGDEEGGEEEEGELDLEAIIRELESELSEEEVDETVEVNGRTYALVKEEDEETVDEVSKDRGENEPSGPAKDGSNSTNEDVEIEIDETVLDEDDEIDEDKEEVDEEVDESSGIGNGTGRGNTDKSSAIGSGGQEKAQKFESVHAELKEYKEAVSFLKDKLHEVNILNAKLLFTNKLFKEYTLNNNQKLKVVETFDRAYTTREIKLVYSTLAEQFGDNGTITRKNSIKESASSTVGSTKPSKESRKVITEEQQVANRFKKLAGIL
jgi:hypothetical protein